MTSGTKQSIMSQSFKLEFDLCMEKQKKRIHILLEKKPKINQWKKIKLLYTEIPISWYMCFVFKHAECLIA